ncbi:ABSCISIC ACID-INSENSITIVE 5-like protein 2 [Cucurbita argyrosperma subsp. argyrosperma]|uniref:ABSCISIC ACID-INSENSITIVE 5-like protein 2 n=1 Tax=Cucurbita moschata TaxID=3662 RepID=A0A6J1HBL0_CUCMO|nr:ABSCISIC ACID-INSENSITIVE 5-like protein 2 [Cucurbita moschata]XP_022961220.1 ABSCISIC ACID-INSENSITIVE 5-like protein 2 [Cucurbita moschata]KAG7033458.1 ABSCISIC ACID-INSENSITIVE 5-like protein 2 [Cucurbita argyrosperma subsp. argyrosperma]
MGIQTMGSQLNGQQSHLQPASLMRQNSWYGRTLDEVKSQLGELGKPVGSMNLDEFLHNIWAAEDNQSMEMESESSSSAYSLQRQASFTLARALSGKTVDDVWREIQQGKKKKKNCEDLKTQSSVTTLGDITLEDFLIQAGLYAEASPSPIMSLDAIDSMDEQTFSQKIGLLSSFPSLGTLSDTTPKRGRDPSDTFEETMDRRLKRKIKNRESAARSRARKQAYHNELVNKVSRLEEENLKLKKEKEFENTMQSEPISEPKYQLRRTSSASF